MNAAWGITTDFKEITISMSEHKTTKNFAITGAFTVSMGTEDQVVACDYVGIESADKVPDKFARAGFHATKSAFVNAPLIDELPMALECKVKSFEDGILIGEIVNVSADESVDTASVLKELNSIRTSSMHKNQAGGSIFGDEAKINSLRLKLDEAKNASLAIEGKTESFERAKAEYDALRLDLEKKDALVGQFNKIALIKRFETLRAKESELPAISQKKQICAKGFLKTDFFPDRTHAAELRAAAREIDERERAFSAKETEKKAHTLGFDVKDAERGEIAEADGGKAEILAPVSKAKADAKRLKDIYIGLGAGSVISVVAGIVLTAFFGTLRR